jgi:uncharacterized membrane protein YphA (DoxX/SURF4 family)
MKKKILLVVSILFGLMFINAGLNKFLNYMPVPDDMPENLVKLMGAFMEIGWLLPLIGVVEITAGILVMINKFRALGAIMILPITVGILLTHIVNAPSGLPIALVLIAINLWIIYEYRGKYKHLVN